MKNSISIVILLLLFFSLSVKAQQQKNGSFLELDPTYVSEYEFPVISKDSTQVEIIAHMDEVLNWMNKEQFKYNFVAPLIYSETALSLTNKLGDKSYLHRTRALIGTIMLRVKDTANAKALFLKTLHDAEATNDSTYILASKGNLANAYYYTGNYNHKAIANYLDGVGIAKNLKDTARIFIMHHNVSRIFLEDKDIKNSSYHIEQSAKFVKNLNNPFYKSGQLRNEGELYVLLNQPDKAIKKFKENIAIAESNQAMDGIIEGHQGYIKALELKGDYEAIYRVNKKLKVYTDKKEKEDDNLTIEAAKARINVSRYKEQIKSKEIEKELLEQQADGKSFLLILVIGVLFFISIIFAQTFFLNKKRKKLIVVLKKKNRQYLEAKKQSEELTKSKSKFFATVSHELRTPLYGVIGLSSILLENNDLKKHEKDLKSLKFSANYLLALINDLLKFNKIENKKFTEENVTFNLKDLINAIVASFEYVILQHENEIKIEIHEDVPHLVRGNSIRLSQILMNLISNTCKFTEKGTIGIEVIVLKELNNKISLQFKVEDNGPGIEQHKLSNIFNEFTQIDTSTSNYQGTGLGLSIVKKLVEQAKGTIKVESELGQGTTFIFNIALETVNKTDTQLTIPIVDFKQLAKKHILIVEDNRINQTVTKRILENIDVVCSIANNGEEAIALVKENTFDLILMDINMPIKNGFEATKKIRDFNTNIPIIALTAVEIEEEKHQIFACGMNDIILKPYDIDQFKTTILDNILKVQMSISK